MVVIVSIVKLNPSGLHLALVQVLIIATTKTGVADPKRGPLLYSIVLITISKAGRQGQQSNPRGATTLLQQWAQLTHSRLCGFLNNGPEQQQALCILVQALITPVGIA